MSLHVFDIIAPQKRFWKDTNLALLAHLPCICHQLLLWRFYIDSSLHREVAHRIKAIQQHHAKDKNPVIYNDQALQFITI